MGVHSLQVRKDMGLAAPQIAANLPPSTMGKLKEISVCPFCGTRLDENLRCSCETTEVRMDDSSSEDDIKSEREDNDREWNDLCQAGINDNPYRGGVI